MRNRIGITLLEVVVVVFCIGIFFALAIPAVEFATSVSPRFQCATNLKNFVMSATLHNNGKGYLPGFLNDYGAFAGTVEPSRPDLSPENLRLHRKIGSWAVALLPHLDAQPTFEAWTEDRYSIVAFGEKLEGFTPEGYLDSAVPNLAIFQCPDDPTHDDDAYGKNSYICNTGMYHRGPADEDEWSIPRMDGSNVIVDFERSMSVANGAFNNQVTCVDALGNSVPIGPKVTLDDFKDGLGNTILFSENLQAMPWYRIGFATANELVVDSPSQPIRYPYASRYVNGMLWHYEDDEQVNGSRKVKSIHLINGTPVGKNKDELLKLSVTPVNAADLARPSSAHVDGVNAGMADGSTRFITDSIDYRVYQALLTPRGKVSDVPFPEFVLIDEAF